MTSILDLFLEGTYGGSFEIPEEKLTAYNAILQKDIAEALKMGNIDNISPASFISEAIKTAQQFVKSHPEAEARLATFAKALMGDYPEFLDANPQG